MNTWLCDKAPDDVAHQLLAAIGKWLRANYDGWDSSVVLMHVIDRDGDQAELWCLSELVPCWINNENPDTEATIHPNCKWQ